MAILGNNITPNLQMGRLRLTDLSNLPEVTQIYGWNSASLILKHAVLP